MHYNFLNIFLDPKEIFNQVKEKIDPILLENNNSQIEKLYEFYKNKTNLVYVNGFIGTGKTQIVKYSTNFLSSEVVLLKYTCSNSTILDDILLTFFIEFRRLSAQNIIIEPKIKTENFTERINAYFSNIDKPFVILLDSFEAILEENRQEIIDFILHLNSMQKIKIVITGRTFEAKYFKDIQIERITTFALEKQIFDKYIKNLKLKAHSSLIDEFYKYTRGYFLYVELSLRIMQFENMSLSDFLTKVNASFLEFHKFLEKQVFGMVPPQERTLFCFLASIRHPVSIELLNKLKFYNEEKINEMIENLILVKEGSLLYVPDYLSEDLNTNISNNILNKVRQYIVDLYLTQLPLKPLERDICLSRQTMRKEIEYQNLFLPKRPKTQEIPQLDINYLTYSKVFNSFEKTKIEDVVKSALPKVQPQVVDDMSIRKNIHINLENLPYQQKQGEKSFGNSANSQDLEKDNISQVGSEYSDLNFNELIELARQTEAKYHYIKVIEIYKKAVQLASYGEYKKYLPVVYTKLANAYKKVADHENAIKYYELAKEIYEDTQDLVKLNQVRFKMANVFYETFKTEKAKEIFTQIVECTQCQPIFVVKSYLQLANIQEGMSDMQRAFEYYKQALSYSDETMSIETLSELYFKYALVMDDKNDIVTAIEFYNKCINLGGDFKSNKFLSSSYSNIATLYLEKNDIESALENYTKAYEIDKHSDNSEGVYYSASKLASILQRRKPNDALRYFEEALKAAEILDDVYYLVSASLAMGDYYYDIKQNEIALKYYISASDMASNTMSADNKGKIDVRINDIKFKLGVERFDELSEVIRNQVRESQSE